MNQQLWHTSECSSLNNTDMPEVSSNDELLIEAELSMISLGSERLALRGEIPADAGDAMRVPYMDGNFDSRFTYGYSLVGNILDGPAESTGKRVHVMHPHQRYALVKSADVVYLPDTLTSEAAVLISNMETAVNAIWDAEVVLGDRVLVIGFGTIGILVSHLLSKIPGVQVTIVERDEDRRQLACSIYSGTSSSVEIVSQYSGPPLDLAFNTGYTSEALQLAIDTVGMEGLVVDLAWHGSNEQCLNLGSSFHYQRKRLISSQVSQIPARLSGKWNHASRKSLVLELLHSVDASPIVSRYVNFCDADVFFNRLRESMPAESGVALRYQDTNHV